MALTALASHRVTNVCTACEPSRGASRNGIFLLRGNSHIENPGGAFLSGPGGGTLLAGLPGYQLFDSMVVELQRAARDPLVVRVHPAGNLGQASRSYGRLSLG
jgi:hypothetical protein